MFDGQRDLSSRQPRASRPACRRSSAGSRRSPTTTAGPGSRRRSAAVRRARRGALAARRRQPGRAAAGGERRPRSPARPRDGGFLERLAAAEASLAADLARGPAGGEALRAFFCAEFAVHASLPIYSGGLGALAGDFLKQASDDALPLVGGRACFYRQGYFRQRIDGRGLQHEYWIDADPSRLPAALVSGEDGAPLTVAVTIADEEVVAPDLAGRRRPGSVVPARHASVPRTARRRAGSPRACTCRRPELRLAQYLLLGVGGVRALRGDGRRRGAAAPQRGPRRVRGARARCAATSSAACRSSRRSRDARRRIAFTTHTPVPAGNDTYPLWELEAAAGGVLAEAGLELEALARLGRSHPRRRRRAVRHDAVRAAHLSARERGQPPPRRGRARDVA